MADVTWTMNINFSGGGVNATDTLNATGKNGLIHQHAWPTATVNQVLDLAFAHANVRAYRLISDQDITLYTNAPSTGSPAETITVGPTNVRYFVASKLGTSLFGTDVTQIYLTNASGATANVVLQFIIDA